MMKIPRFALAIVTPALLATPVSAQFGPQNVPHMRGDGPSPTPEAFRIDRADPALDALIAPGTKLTEVARGFGINEGPVWVREGKSGYLLISSHLQGRAEWCDLGVHGKGRLLR
jgi:hypothetical protein